MRRNLAPQPREETGSRLFRLGGLAGLLLGLLLLLLLVLDFLVMPRITRQGAETLTPGVLGLSLPEAEQSLRQAGFEPVVEARRPDPAGRYAAGAVMGQYPRPGRLSKSGRSVLLTVSTGGRLMRVPDLQGATLRQALGLLGDARLEEDTLARHWRHDERFGEGCIVAQLPAPGDSLTPGDRVSLTLSLGPAPEWVSTPSVLGLGRLEAGQWLERAGLAVGFVDALAGEETGLTVLEQDPAPGTPLVPGSAVDLRFKERSQP
ncbi:MAG: PASTA domain-containing protein [Candidatus Delongbacteria bacterium]